jgi:branched-chain amino acid transport system permease protein
MVSTGLLIDQIITGLSIGSWLFLVAVGLSLIFGVLDVLNFAHGVLFMIGAYVSIVVIKSVGSFWLGVVLAALAVGVVGLFIEVIFLRRLYDREPLDQLLLTFAFVLIITDSIRFIFGSGSRVIAPPALFQGNIVFAQGVGIPKYRALVILVSLVVIGAILVALRTTNFGRIVRATASDRDMALLLGIDVPRLYTGVFFIGAALAGIGGAFVAPLQSVTPELGNQVIINAFVIVVIGGLGSFTGAFIGAYLIGLMIAVGSVFAAGAGQLFPFVALIAVLLLKPEGLVGGAES